MKAVILAGGEGTRLRPLTSNQPKPMMPIANAPMMEHIVRLLASHGFDDIVVTVAFLANHIRNYFGDGSEFGVRMQYATEESPLGTAGAVRNAMEQLDETFLVVAGDALTDVDLGAVLKAHRAADAFGALALKRVAHPRTSSTAACTWRCPASRCARACGWVRAPTSRPMPRSTARSSSGTTPASRPARCSGRTPCSAPTLS